MKSVLLLPPGVELKPNGPRSYEVYLHGSLIGTVEKQLGPRPTRYGAYWILQNATGAYAQQSSRHAAVRDLVELATRSSS